ncbi:MAG: hypothetical protein QMD71_09685 [bacterium]|nr:hypothetical protein [bacterium]
MDGYSIAWTKTYGGSGSENGRSVRQTADGGYIVVGGTSSYGAGGFDIWLIKTDFLGYVYGVKENKLQPLNSKSKMEVYPNPFTRTTEIRIQDTGYRLHF